MFKWQIYVYGNMFMAIWHNYLVELPPPKNWHFSKVGDFSKSGGIPHPLSPHSESTEQCNEHFKNWTELWRVAKVMTLGYTMYSTTYYIIYTRYTQGSAS